MLTDYKNIMWLFLSSPSLCIILHPQLLLSSSQCLRKKPMSKVLQCITVPWYEERLVCVTNRIRQKWWLPLLRLGYKRQCGFYPGGGCSLYHQASSISVSFCPHSLKKPGAVSSMESLSGEEVKPVQNSVRTWGLRTSTWMALEVDLPCPVIPYDDFPG